MKTRRHFLKSLSALPVLVSGCASWAKETGTRWVNDFAIKRNGSYYLTYHKWATKEQLLKCHPRLPTFLNKKLTHDPDETFQSNWYRHNKNLIKSV